jgi:hypothetical protein
MIAYPEADDTTDWHYTIVPLGVRQDDQPEG